VGLILAWGGMLRQWFMGRSPPQRAGMVGGYYCWWVAGQGPVAALPRKRYRRRVVSLPGVVPPAQRAWAHSVDAARARGGSNLPAVSGRTARTGPRFVPEQQPRPAGPVGGRPHTHPTPPPPHPAVDAPAGGGPAADSVGHVEGKKPIPAWEANETLDTPLRILFFVPEEVFIARGLFVVSLGFLRECKAAIMVARPKQKWDSTEKAGRSSTMGALPAEPYSADGHGSAVPGQESEFSSMMTLDGSFDGTRAAVFRARGKKKKALLPPFLPRHLETVDKGPRLFRKRRFAHAAQSFSRGSASGGQVSCLRGGPAESFPMERG